MNSSRPNGEKITEQEKIKEEIKLFFENLYGEEEYYDLVDLEQMSMGIPYLITKEGKELLF